MGIRLKKDIADDIIDVQAWEIDDNGKRRFCGINLGVLGGLFLGIFNILRNIFSKVITRHQIWSLVNALLVWLTSRSALNFIFRKTFVSEIVGIFPHIKILALIKSVCFFALLISALFSSAKNRQGLAIVILILSAVPLVIVGKMGGITLFFFGGVCISIFAETAAK